MSEFQSISLALLLTVAWAAWAARVACTHERKKDISYLSSSSTETTLVAFASQTGTAELLAKKIADQQGSVAVALNELSLKHIINLTSITFVVSTYGDGEPPDNGKKFFKQLQQKNVKLTGLKFAIIALGDKTYPGFCAFGYALQNGLLHAGAIEQKSIELHDRLSAEHIAGVRESGKALQQCSLRLIQQKRLNSGVSDGLFELQFAFVGKIPQWRAGDLVDFKLPDSYQDPHIRTYSIASVPEEGVLKLIVRQHKQENGEYGVCSKWLTVTLTEGDSIHGFLRKNKACYLHEHQSPLLLIATGSGLAGIRSQVMARKRSGSHGPMWLIYGERYPEHDEPFAEELKQWVQDGTLAQLDKVFSRCSQQPLYVQDLLVREQAQIRQFLNTNGHIYVCGRHHPMGVETDHALRNILGNETYELMLEQHRYHRDTY